MAKIPKAPTNHCLTDRLTPAHPPRHRHGTPRTTSDAYRVRIRFAITARDRTKRRQGVRSRATHPRQGHSIVHASDASGNRQRPTGRAQPQAERRAKPQEVGKGADVAPAAPEVRERGPRATKCVPPPGVASRPRGAALKCIVHRLAHKTVLCVRLASTPSQQNVSPTIRSTNASSASSLGRSVRN